MCIPAQADFPEFEGIEALLAIQQSPPRCMALSTAAASACSGSSPFHEHPSPSRSPSTQPSVMDSLLSFARCISPLVPSGAGQVSRDLMGFAGKIAIRKAGRGLTGWPALMQEGSAPSLPKHSRATEVQMLMPSHRLLHVCDRQGTPASGCLQVSLRECF